MTHTLRLAVLGLLVSCIGGDRLLAQAPVSFEVASVKPSDPNASNGILGQIPMMRPQGAGGIAISNMTLRILVRTAYGLQDFQIAGGPSWQMANRFDITAKAPAGSTQSTQDLLPMIKTLLADRFKLKTHTESRELPTYALVVSRSDGKLGPALKQSTSDCNPADTQKRAEALAKDGGAGVLAALTKGEAIPCMVMPAINPQNPAAGFGMRGNGQAMSALTQMLTQITGRVVNDKTGLTGLWDWEMRFDPQILMAVLPQLGINIPGAAANAEKVFGDSPSLMTALGEQLGLKLDSERGPVEVLVIDSAEMPEPD